MQLDDLLRLLRTRWYVIVAVTGTIVVLTWALVPSRLPSSDRPRFRATTTLVAASGAGTATTTRGQSSQLETYVLLATQGRVPNVVAEQAGIAANDLLARVEVTSSRTTNSLSVAVVDRTPEAAVRLAELLATELVRALSEQAAAQRAATRANLVEQVDILSAEAARLAERATVDPSAKAALDATNRQLNTQRSRITEIDGAVPAPPLRPLGPAAVGELNQTSAADKLLALPVRTLLAFLFGIGASLGVLFLADRLDVRLHTKEAVEVAFGLPVLAEVPVLARKLRNRLVLLEAPQSAFVEAHRILRTSVEVGELALGGSDEPEHERPRLIIVTSADPGEGKTTTATNLAASFAEAGRTTLLVGGDLRHSDLRDSVRRQPRAEVISIGRTSADPRPVHIRISTTSIERLRAATVEPPVGRPPVVLPLISDWLKSLRSEVDVIVVDTPPILVCNDASELIPGADAVLVVCRVGNTTAEAALRCSEVLARLRARVIGVVMVGAPLRAPVRKVYGYGLSGAIWRDEGSLEDEEPHLGDPPRGDGALQAQDPDVSQPSAARNEPPEQQVSDVIDGVDVPSQRSDPGTLNGRQETHPTPPPPQPASELYLEQSSREQPSGPPVALTGRKPRRWRRSRD